VEFARASQKGPHLAPRIGAARLSRRVLILFSGPYARPDGLVAFLQCLGLEVVPVDNDSSGGDNAHDLLRNDFYSNLLRRAQRGEFLVIWAAPPCSTFSICRFLPTRTPGGGPPIIRRRQEGQVTGARDCPQKNRRELKISNELTSRTVAILRAGFDAGSECGLENPVDAGDEDHPEHLVDREHAPLWLMPEVIAFKEHAGCREVTFPQCAFGAVYRKMTTFLLTPALGHLLGDLNDLRCNHTHHERRAGGERDAQGVWNSKAAAAYPPDLNWTLAGAFNALVDDPSARHERRFRQIATPTNLPASAGAIGPPRPLPRTPPQLPPPTPSFLPSQAPDEPWDVGATAEPQPAPAKATPSSVEDTPDMQTQPSALPDLPSSRTRSKTAEIASMGAALIATGLNDVSSDAIVILSGETHKRNPQPVDPKSHKDALAHADAEAWLAAERKELQNHTVHKTFEQLDRSSLQADAQTRNRLIPLQWVYKTKRDGSKKARLVVVGCAQRPGVDFDQTHCSTLKATSLRFLAATAAIQGLHMRRFDFVSAFLQGDLEPGEQIACRPPPGYETLGDDGNHKIWRVLKPIYGMQQGGRRWQRSLFPWFTALGFRQCEADNCVFAMTTAGDALYVGCYVDDLFILYLQDGADSLYASFTHKLAQRWEVEDEGEVADLLNIEISRQSASVTLRQTAYIDKLTKEWFPEGPPAHVQLNSVPHPENIRELVIHATGEGAAPADPTLINKYCKLVGALLYAATSTRPDIAYATSMLCRAMSKPTDELLAAALRVLAYLSRHKQVGLRYTPCTRPLEGFADADWAVRHSQSGFVFQLGRAAVSWGSKKQVSVALSTCEAEIMAASEAAKEAIHLRALYNELAQCEAKPTRLHLDCKAAIDIAYNPQHHSKLKHVERRHFFIR